MSKAILLADDSVTIQKVIELTFMDQDYQIEAVSSGDEAMRRLDEGMPDLVIADVHMPGASGFDVARRSKEIRPETPVLVLVGTFEPFDEGDFSASGADEVLKKPFDSQELLRLVEKLLPASPGAPEAAGGAPAPAEAAAEAEEEDSGVFALDEGAFDGSTETPPAMDLSTGDPTLADEPEAPPIAEELPEPDLPELDPVAVEAQAPEPEPAEAVGFAPPAFAEPVSAEPASEEPAFAEPASAEPAFAEPVSEEPAFAEPAPVEPASGLPAFEESAPEPPVAEAEEEPAAEEVAAAEVEEEPAAAQAEAAAPPAAAADPSSALLSDEDIERIAEKVARRVGEKLVRDIAWDVIPDLAEVIIKQRIRELESQVE